MPVTNVQGVVEAVGAPLAVGARDQGGSVGVGEETIEKGLGRGPRLGMLEAVHGVGEVDGD